MSFLSKNYSLVKVVYMLIRCYKTRFFLRNRNNTDKNGVNKTQTHTPTQALNTQRKITPPILPTPPFLCEKSEPPFFQNSTPTLNLNPHSTPKLLHFLNKKQINLAA